MRIWDIHPGYLSGDRLLVEHAALHRVASALLRDGKSPEASRWRGCRWALSQRHRLVVAEMALRGRRHRSPLRFQGALGLWPETFQESPAAQFDLLRRRREGMEEAGRIALPRSSHELWGQHKYSVMARNQSAYRELGRRVSRLRGREQFDELALELVGWLRKPPPRGNLRNAMQHMWGYRPLGREPAFERLSLKEALDVLQADCFNKANTLSTQTALADLGAWL